MKKKSSVMKVLEFICKNVPVIGGYSIKDADELMKDPKHYNYRGISWFKKMEDKWLSKDKKKH